MDEPRAHRTLVKSPPELWAEVSDAGALAGHLGAFGEIRITRLEPETTVAWEGDRARGTVELEPSGWGTRVTLTAEMTAVDEASAVEDEAAGEPEPARDPAGASQPAAETPRPRRRGLFARLFARRREPDRAAPEPAPAPESPAPSEHEPPPEAPSLTTEPAPLHAGRAEEILVGVLDDLGAARHRPFSRG
jgi:hypothetical protein